MSAKVAAAQLLCWPEEEQVVLDRKKIIKRSKVEASAALIPSEAGQDNRHYDLTQAKHLRPKGPFQH